MDTRRIYEQVGHHYSQIAKGEKNTGYESKVAAAFGYSEEELTSIPQDANLGVSCGNPTALANLKEGETVIDLGSGAGFDVFLAAAKVGSKGRAIGVDMNKDMLDRAQRNLFKSSSTNITFIEAEITSIPLNDGSADCIISNCVINLVPQSEKMHVFQEMYRLLKSGGRIAVSDILAKKPLPADFREDMAAYVGCISGASQVTEYEGWLRDVGFEGVTIADTGADLNIYITAKEQGNGGGCCSAKEEVGDGLKGAGVDGGARDFNEWAGSYKIYALKP
ncbi:ubiE/COQ5 methyltransferase [Amniculicola lignicola CBS 123094]|uniref:Arsenite methyltransferase n=1 Tax=Amniculicola lignicola CBS 123094 TaxID=1392246 RepID=A0A6A5WGD9_9PLEO|nr:ubiE/COQ5 methyltransferase [Amniculicola lignicola CBS 123094]